MTTPKNARSIQEHGHEEFGLLANGSSAEWEAAIDESLSGAERWYMQLEGPTISFYFEIPSLDIVGDMRRFLESVPATDDSSNGSERNDSLVLGKDKKTPITLIKDDEYSDRFFLVVGETESPIARFVIAGMDAPKIAEALRQLQEDLEDEA